MTGKTEMTERITAERVCKVLEGMYLLDMHEKWDGTKFVPNPDFASSVYMWCHIVEGSTCKNPHEDWVQNFLETEKAVLEAMESPAAKEKRKESA
jgi:hypothetical protein